MSDSDTISAPPRAAEPAPYTISRKIPASMANVESRAREALKAQGFGVLTEIDVASTMHEKLGEEMPGYRILGACNPRFAFGAIGIEPLVGAMLPCNVVLREVEGGTEISAIDPVASMQAIPNAELKKLAAQVRELLKKAIAAV